MKLKAEVETIISQHCNEVFEAIVDPEKMSNYFISGGIGRIEEGNQVIWKWYDVGAELLIKVIKVVKDANCITFLWSASGVETTVEISLEPSGEKTVIKVSEDG